MYLTACFQASIPPVTHGKMIYSKALSPTRDTHPGSISAERTRVRLSPSRQNLVMVAGGAIFALYEVSTALSVREQRRLEAAGSGPIAKVAAKVCHKDITTVP